MTTYAIVHSTDFGNTSTFNSELDSPYFSNDAARAAAEAFKRSAVPTLATGTYKLAGIVDATDFDDAYHKSQNLAKAWEHGQRSTSVGDMIMKLNEDYTYAENGAVIVEGFGFCQLMGV